MPNTEVIGRRRIEQADTERVPSRSLRPESFGLSDIGRARSKNEDAFLIASLERALLVEGSNLPVGQWPQLSAGLGGWMFMVADGMGGQGGGEVASRVAIATVAEYVVSRMPWTDRLDPRAAPGHVSLPEIRTGLDRAIHAGDEQVKRVGQRGAHPHMGTTLTLAYVLWPRLYVVHAGDSRCYVYRGGRLNRLTRDHNLAEEVERMGVEPGAPDSALQNVLLNALGTDVELRPEIGRYELEPGDALLLCSDGLTKHVPDESVAQMLAKGWSSKRSCEELVNVANAAGGSDNVTVVIAKF